MERREMRVRERHDMEEREGALNEREVRDNEPRRGSVQVTYSPDMKSVSIKVVSGRRYMSSSACNEIVNWTTEVE